MYLWGLSRLGTVKPPTLSLAPAVEASVVTPPPKSVSRGTLAPVVLAASGPTMINSDVNEDREPSITTVRNGVTHAETQYSAWMQFYGGPNAPNFRIMAASNNGGGWSVATTLQGPRANNGDPLLSPNNYLGGLNPQTVYLSTASVSPGPGTPYGDNGLLVWMNNGSGWSYQEVESHTGTSYSVGNQIIDDRFLIDKPSIVVSQDPNTAGTVYATYLRNPVNGAPSFTQSIGFAMLDDVTPPAGQWKIRANVPNPPSGSGGLQSPIVVVPQISHGGPYGRVYVIYLDWGFHRIYVYESDDKGFSCDPKGYFDLLNDSTIRLAVSPEGRICVNRSAGDCIIAASIISARYNWHEVSDTPSGSIGIVLNAWDGPDVNTAKMHSYFFRWNPAPTCNPVCSPGFDRGPFALTDASLDSWDPAIDYDPAGNYVVSWYRRTDTSTLQYKTAFSYVLNGGTLDHTISCPTCRTSDIRRYAIIGSPPYAYSIGDYQDIWYPSYLGFAASATVDIATSYGDIAAFNVVP
ncbi:MAG: hypothetical protein QOC81_2375 [Thermoanaerobaculia bacterium]|nr:hypothetical protein [Thermoanaerobaculia bacterium]